jgi:hypothetical protein
VCPSVDLDHDETQFRQRLRVASRRVERAASNAACLRPRVDVIDDRVLPGGIEIRRLVHQPVQVRDAIAGFHGDRNRRLPAGRHQPRDVRFLQRQHEFAVRIAHLRGRRHVRFRVGVEEKTSRRRQRHVVVGVLGGQQRQVLPVHAHAIEVSKIGVAPLLAPDRHEIELAALFVNAEQLRDIAGARGDRELLPARLQVVQVEMAPVVALRKPDDLVDVGR